VRHRKTGPSVLLLLGFIVGFGAGEVLKSNAHDGTHLIPSHSSSSALFRAWR
jgi:hypothetical protein